MPDQRNGRVAISPVDVTKQIDDNVERRWKLVFVRNQNRTNFEKQIKPREKSH